MPEIAVKVAVRVRPFNDREKAMNCPLAVSMSGKSTTLKDLDDTMQEKQFTFDHSFWSHDQFKEDQKTGQSVPDGPQSNYASQEMVYKQLGVQVLNNAWDGYHCCLFAYGQTGAGKSYSMVGYGANKGIVPMACDEIFQRISKNNDKNLEYDVVVSYLEIYNEKIQDLLLDASKRPPNGLDVRESKELGIYVANLTKCKVTSYKEIDQITEQAMSNRTIGATLMNATSSRAHTVLCIEMRQLSHVGDRTGVKLSCIYLVDLAGSEKASKTGATGDRLKEGSAINKSLTCLGNVIEKLADQCSGKGKGGVVPYRDSKLTRLLQNALGGNSFTVMIVAISPASNNYAESLSTLRYADRAKKIKNTSVVNEDPQDKVIRQLREENAKLREMLEKGGGVMSGGGGETKTQIVKEVDEEAMKKAQEEHQSEIEALEQALIEMQADFFKKLQDARAQGDASPTKEKEVVKEIVTVKEIVVQETAVREKHLDYPHISNIHEDPMLTGKLHYPFPVGSETTMGRQTPEYKPDVILAGVGIQKKHCRITHGKLNNKGPNRVWLHVDTQEAASGTFVNGDNFFFELQKDEDGEEHREGTELKHGDRIVIGQNYVFVFIDNKKEEFVNDLLDKGKVSYELAKKELAEKQGDIGQGQQQSGGTTALSSEEIKKKAEETKKLKADFEKKLKEAEEMKAKAQLDMELMMKKQEEDHRRALEKIKNDLENQKKSELERREKGFNDKLNTITSAKIDEDDSMISGAEGELRKMQEDFQRKKREMELKARREIKLLEKRQATLEAKEQLRKEKDHDISMINEMLMLNVPLAKEATALAQELGKEYSYFLKLLVKPVMDAAGKKSARLLNPELVCQCKNPAGETLFEWDCETLENRVFLMRELFDHWCVNEDFDINTSLPLSRDPFWDPILTEHYIGSIRVYLEPLIYGVDIQVDAKLLASDGKPGEAFLKLEIKREILTGTAADAKGGGGGSGSNLNGSGPGGRQQYTSIDKLEDDSENNLAGKNFKFSIKILRLRKLSNNYKKPRVEFQYYTDECSVVKPKKEERHKSMGKNEGPDYIFDSTRTFKQDPVTERYIDYLKGGAISFAIYATDKRSLELEKLNQVDQAVEDRKEKALAINSPGSDSDDDSDDNSNTDTRNNFGADGSTSNPFFLAEQSTSDASRTKPGGKSLAEMAEAEFGPKKNNNSPNKKDKDKNNKGGSGGANSSSSDLKSKNDKTSEKDKDGKNTNGTKDLDNSNEKDTSDSVGKKKKGPKKYEVLDPDKEPSKACVIL